MGKRWRFFPFCGSVKQNVLSVRVASLICFKDKCCYQVSVILSTCVVTGTMCPSGEAALFACILQVTPPFSPHSSYPHIYVRSFVCFFSSTKPSFSFRSYVCVSRHTAIQMSIRSKKFTFLSSDFILGGNHQQSLVSWSPQRQSSIELHAVIVEQ